METNIQLRSRIAMKATQLKGEYNDGRTCATV
jgi:hypothetical protein